MMADESKIPRQETKKNGRKDYVQLDNLLKILDCPVCWTRADPETIVQCRNGHLGCQACLSRLRKCPLCRVILKPEIQTFSQEILDTIKKELRHVEGPMGLVCPEAIVRIFRCFFSRFTATQGPVYQCHKGHVHCYRCPGLGTLCGPCVKNTGKFSNIVFEIRSLAFQELLSLVPKPCRFSNHGCSTIIKGLCQHEINCQFSENCCIIPACPYTVSLPKLLTHILQGCSFSKYVLINSDPSKFRSTSVGSMTIPLNAEGELTNKSYDQVAILKLATDRYFLFSCISTTLDVIFYANFFGTPREATNFNFTLVLKPNEDRSTIERKGPVFSANFCKFTAFSHPDVIKISYTEIREMLEINSLDIKFKYEVEVMEINVEACDKTK